MRLQKLRGRSLAELRDRLTQVSRAMAERRGFTPVAIVPGDIELRPVTPWGAPNIDAIISRISAPVRDGILAAANHVVAGTFDLLGLSAVSYGSPVRWQFDPLSGREAALDHWSRVPYLDYARVGDHKVTWELNRHQWLVTLGQAWLLTGDARYATVAAQLLQEWLVANPPKRGINWCSALEMAFRVQSWVHGLRLFEGAPDISNAVRRDMVVSAATQIDHITRNLSTWFSPNTHLTGEAAAILAAGCAWPQLPHAERWRSLGWQILCDESTKQIRADGVYFEQSAWYQAYTLDTFVFGMTWAEHAGLAIPDALRVRVRAAARALRAVTRPDGTIARLGDDDGGRALPLTPLPFGDMTDSLWRAGYHLGDGSLIPPHDAGRPSLLWLEGAAAYDQMGRQAATVEGRASVALRDGGWVVMAEAAVVPTRDHWLVFDVGPHGALSHAHSHADALGIDLSVHGVPIFVDPGTMSYVGQARRRYRSTAVHNTVTVDGADSSEQGTSFNWQSATDSTLQGFGRAGGATFVSGSHDGYYRLADPVRHHRTILRIDRRYWLMFDRLDAASGHEITLTLQTAPHVRVAERGPGTFELRAADIVVHVAHDRRLRSSTARRTTSPAYALELPADAIVASGSTIGSIVLCTAIGADDECGPIVMQHDAVAGTWSLSHRSGGDVVACPAGKEVVLGPARFDGAAFALLGEAEPHTIVAAGAGTLHLAGRATAIGADDIRVVHRTPDGTWTTEF